MDRLLWSADQFQAGCSHKGFYDVFAIILVYNGSAVNVIVNYLVEIESQLIDLRHFNIISLEFEQIEGDFQPNLPMTVAIISSMQREFSDEVAMRAFDLCGEILASGKPISRELKTRVLIFLHFILIRCDNLVDVPDDRLSAVHQVRTSIMQTFLQLSPRLEDAHS